MRKEDIVISRILKQTNRVRCSSYFDELYKRLFVYISDLCIERILLDKNSLYIRKDTLNEFFKDNDTQTKEILYEFCKATDFTVTEIQNGIKYKIDFNLSTL